MHFYNYCELALIVLSIFGNCFCDSGKDKSGNSSQENIERVSAAESSVSYRSVQNPSHKNQHDNYYSNSYPYHQPYYGHYGGYPLRRDSYLEAASSGSSYPPSQGNLAGTYHYKIIPEPEMEECETMAMGYGYSRTDSKHKCKGKEGGGLHGLWGLFGLFGLKGLASLLLPLGLLGLLGLLLLLLFIPVPVVTVPVPLPGGGGAGGVGGRANTKMDYVSKQIIDSVLEEDGNCVERISCEISKRLNKKSVKQNLKSATKSMDEWFRANNSTTQSTDNSSLINSTISFLQKLAKGIDQGINQEARSGATCAIYSKCRIFEFIKQFYTKYSNKGLVKARPKY